MKLFEHPDFTDILLAAADRFAMPVQFVQKDYFVTEALRLVAEEFGSAVVFKGGTSLSKGWRLVARFSENVDLFVNPVAFDPPLESKNRINKALKRLRDVVAIHPALIYLEAEGHTTGGLAREDHFRFESRFADLPGIRPTLMVEPGIRSGDAPTTSVGLQSYASEFLEREGVVLEVDDLASFEMRLLHFRRTFVEKLLAVHSKIMAVLEDASTIDREARHYADIHSLLQTPEVQRMLRSDEYAAIKADCDAVSRRFFANYRPPEDLNLSASPALFPDGDLQERLRAAYDAQCALLFYGPYPSFDEVLAALQRVRDYV